MKQVSKSELKAKMFEYLRWVEEAGEPLVVNNFGKPVILISKIKPSVTVSEAFSSFRDRASIDDALLLESEEDHWRELKG